MTLYGVPPGGIVTVSYQAKADSSDLGSGVKSYVTNTARLSTGRQDSARVTLTGPDVYVPPDPPTTDRPTTTTAASRLP